MSSTDLITETHLFGSHCTVITGCWQHPTTHLPAAPSSSMGGFLGLHQSIFLMDFFFSLEYSQSFPLIIAGFEPCSGPLLGLWYSAAPRFLPDCPWSLPCASPLPAAEPSAQAAHTVPANHKGLDCNSYHTPLHQITQRSLLLCFPPKSSSRSIQSVSTIISFHGEP